MLDLARVLLLDATLIKWREELYILGFLLQSNISLTLLRKEQRGELEDLLQVHIFFAIELLILTDALLQLPYLFSQALNVLSDFFDLGTVLNEEPISVDDWLDDHRSEDFDRIVVFELQTVHLNAEHLRQLLDPLGLYGLSSLVVRCKVVVDLVLVQILPGLVHVFGFKHA